ncbi:MAG: DUF6789 family protein [Myxococcota bacterium]
MSDSRELLAQAKSIGRVVSWGAVAGAGATVVMSAWMYASQRLGLLGRAPPRHIVEKGLARLGLRHRVSVPARQALTAALHLAFGATQGAVYALAEQGLAASRHRELEPSLARGVPFALAVWATSYAGWIPALGILPPPSRDRPGRPTSMVIAHVVYGAALAALLRRVELRRAAAHA